ncbi:hypothetical protein CDO73_19595 [Saccharibacillus sp. O23]|nr:hypothetical protein CDO73_19595 [Saccharibacillus sp. O23]
MRADGRAFSHGKADAVRPFFLLSNNLLRSLTLGPRVAVHLKFTSFFNIVFIKPLLSITRATRPFKALFVMGYAYLIGFSRSKL